MYKILILIMISLSITGCTNLIEDNHVRVSNHNLSKIDIKGNVLLLTPIVQNKEFTNFANGVGSFLQLEMAKKIHGQLVYSKEVESLKDAINWNNLIKNGTYNIPEILEIGKTLKCDSILICKLQSVNNYSPFRAMLEIKWINIHSGEVLANLKNDADLRNGVTKNNFKSFVKKEDKYLFQKILSNEDTYKTASLKPTAFQNFMAVSSVNALFNTNLNKQKSKTKYSNSKYQSQKIRIK